VVAASMPLAAGIAIVFYKVTDSIGNAAAAGATARCVPLDVWLAYPIWRRTLRLRLPGGKAQRHPLQALQTSKTGVCSGTHVISLGCIVTAA
jgi:hypothetical protein